MKKTLLILSSGLLVSLTSCKNPADETTDAVVAPATSETAPQAANTHVFTDASTIGFVGSKLTGSHEGGFNEFEGGFAVVDGAPVAGNFTIDMASTWSDDDKLTEHLKSEDFFNVESFPESTFQATAFTKAGENTYNIAGNLKLHGVTKNITFPATVSTTDSGVTVSAEFDINRHDFEIDYPGKKDDLIRKNVVLKLQLEAEEKSANTL